MEPHTFFIQLVLILVSARLVGEFVAYFNVPSVIGELLAGIIIGPSLLGWVALTEPVQLLAQIGIVLLLFEVGLETDIGKLTSAGGKALSVAVIGVVLPFAFGYIISYYFFGFSLLASLLIGSTLTATSIGITLRVLQDLKKHNTHESQIILGAAVIDDIIGIVLLAMLYEFSNSGEVNLWNAGKMMVLIVLFFLISPFAAKLISQTIKSWNDRSEIPGLLPTMIVSLILLFSWMAHSLDAPELLGGFAAGLALSKRFYSPFGKYLKPSPEFSHRVEEQMKPIVYLFTPIFFVSIGLSLNLKDVEWSSLFIWILTGTLLLAAVFGKLFSGFVLRRESLLSKWIIGTAMIPRGEVGLIFANIGLTTGVLANEPYTALILVIAFTTLMAPFALRWFYRGEPIASKR